MNQYTSMVLARMGLFALLLLFFMYAAGCKSGDASKMNETENTNADLEIVKIVNLVGDVMFNDIPVTTGAMLSGGGTLKTIGKSSWVDLEYLGGVRVRLKNGSIEISFGDPMTSNIGIDFGGGSPGSSIRRIKLNTGTLFVCIEKFEQLKKLQYYFLTDIVDLINAQGAFVMGVKKNANQVTVCDGSVSIEPSLAMSGTRPSWPEILLSSGKTISIKTNKISDPVILSKTEQELMIEEFRSMGIAKLNCN